MKEFRKALYQLLIQELPKVWEGDAVKDHNYNVMGKEVTLRKYSSIGGISIYFEYKFLGEKLSFSQEIFPFRGKFLANDILEVVKSL